MVQLRGEKLLACGDAGLTAVKCRGSSTGSVQSGEGCVLSRSEVRTARSGHSQGTGWDELGELPGVVVQQQTRFGRDAQEEKAGERTETEGARRAGNRHAGKRTSLERSATAGWLQNARLELAGGADWSSACCSSGAGRERSRGVLGRCAVEGAAADEYSYGGGSRLDMLGKELTGCGGLVSGGLGARVEASGWLREGAEGLSACSG